MPLGLASAPWVFTKLTRPISLFCRQLGMHIIFYLDDTIIMARSREALILPHELLISLFPCLGLKVNLAKSDLVPSQDFIFLGLLWDTISVSVSLPDDKEARLESQACCILNREGASCWCLP